MYNSSMMLPFFSFLRGADDHRMFCGDLGNEVNDEVLAKAFTRFPTYIMSRVGMEGWIMGRHVGRKERSKVFETWTRSAC